jgi:hypothetical protein
MVNAGWYGKESMPLVLAMALTAEVINADYGRVVLPIGARGS